MKTSQNSLEVVSRNVANSGTPGYHRQSLSVIDTKGVNSAYARSSGVERAFDQSLQAYYTTATADAGYAGVRADMLNRLQTYLGKPGDAGALDTMFNSLQNSLQQLGTSPDNYATRATAVSQAQGMATTLNRLTSDVQGLRQETESKIASDVDSLNQQIGSLQKINDRLSNQTIDLASRSALMDQRDRLVAGISQVIDVRVDYRADGTVGLMTHSGVGILDNKASVFEFQSAGTISASQQFNVNADQNGVGTLVLRTPAGLSIDLVQQNALKSGELAGLIDLRDNTLVKAQDQLDDIAAGLAQAMSTVTTNGTAATAGAQQGFSLDLSNIRDGNDFQLDYTVNSSAKSIKVVNVGDSSKLPLDYLDANGTRVIGLDFSAGTAAIASTLTAKLGPGFSVSNPSGNVLQVVDDGGANTTSIAALTGHSTATGLQGDVGLNLFVDAGNADFTNSLDGPTQKRGFAGRIEVNSAVVADNKLLVQYQAGGSLGDAARANYLSDQLGSMKFASQQSGLSEDGSFRLGGTVSDLISQTMDYQGTLNERMDSEYGVNVDDEMARLMELQNAYAANARVISVVQDLLDKLMQL
jgi:flagellar hook-associated protein 1 FlgK